MSDNISHDPFGDRSPPRALQDRVTRTLHDRGLVESRSARVRRQMRQGISFAALAIIAFAAGRFQSARPEADPRREYLFLLYEDSSYHDARPVGQIVSEYRAWGDSLRRENDLVLGHKLAEGHVQLPAEQPGVLPTGLFIVRATDLQSATAVAATSPHLRHGGRVVVHEIEH